MDDDLKTEIERLILTNCFVRQDSDEVDGADFAAEAIVKVFEREAAENYRSTVLDMTTRQ